MTFLPNLAHCKLEAVFPEDQDEEGEGQVLHYEYTSSAKPGPRSTKIVKRWRRQELLGSGSFGDVWLEVLQDQPDMKRAVKVLQKRRMKDAKIDYTKELKALAEFSRAKYRQQGLFVEFLGWFDNTKTDSVFLAMEYFPKGDLEGHMNSVFSEPAVRQISTQILQGLKSMHAEGYAHRDLKPANIFVVQDSPLWRIKLGDFGISKHIENNGTNLRTFLGTFAYMAPEFFDYVDDGDEESSTYTDAVDLWALGCIMYQLYTHRVPFPAHSNLTPLKRYCMGKTPFPLDPLRKNNVTKLSAEFMMRLLEPRPSSRLTAQDALETAWLNSVDGIPSEPLGIVYPSPKNPFPPHQPQTSTMVKNYGKKTSSVSTIATSPASPATTTSHPRPPYNPTIHPDSPLSSSGSDISDNDIPTHLTPLELHHYKKDYKLVKAARKGPTYKPVWEDGPRHAAQQRIQLAKEPPPDPNAPRNLVAAASTIRMPKLIPTGPPFPLDCPLAHGCGRSFQQNNGFKSREEVNKHLETQHRDWKSTYAEYEERGCLTKSADDGCGYLPYDCPLSKDCARKGRHGFKDEEGVREHLRVCHGHKRVREGDLLLPILRMGF